MNPEPILPVYIDSTMRTSAASCLEKFRLEFVYGLRPPGISIDLHAGACIATGLEEFYNGIFALGLSDDDALNRALAIYEQAWGDVVPPEHKINAKAKTKDRCWQAIVGGQYGETKKPEPREQNRGYLEVYGKRTDHVQPYFTTEGKPCLEYTFTIPLEPAIHPHGFNTDHLLHDGVDKCFPLHPSGQPFIYCGRFDLLGRMGDKPVWRDEKSTGVSIGNSWSQQWDLRSQFMGYCWALQQAGIPCDTGVVRGIGIQMTQLVHVEAIKTFSAFKIQRWHEQLRRDMWKIRRAWDEGYFDFDLGNTCSSYGGCPFLDLCGSPNAEAWMSAFEVRRWNPLIKNPIAEPMRIAA